MKKTVITFFTLAASFATQAQSLGEAFKPTSWASYIFVSTSMPRSSVMQLAKEAAMSRSTLVLRGFDKKNQTMEGVQAYVNDINGNCCGKNPPSWVVHPKLYETFNVRVTPAFVLSKGQSPSQSDFALISGDMSLGNALKFFAQGSANSEIRTKASEIYTKTFASR
jgi:conjugal transfer pilus assembly protein TrbC